MDSKAHVITHYNVSATCHKVCSTSAILAMQTTAHVSYVNSTQVCILFASGANSSAGKLLQDFLGFAPSKQAMAVVQRVTQAHAVQQQQAAASRLKHAAALTAQRCAAAPLYGRDLRQVGSSKRFECIILY